MITEDDLLRILERIVEVPCVKWCIDRYKEQAAQHAVPAGDDYGLEPEKYCEPMRYSKGHDTFGLSTIPSADALKREILEASLARLDARTRYQRASKPEATPIGKRQEPIGKETADSLQAYYAKVNERAREYMASNQYRSWDEIEREVRREHSAERYAKPTAGDINARIMQEHARNLRAGVFKTFDQIRCELGAR